VASKISGAISDSQIASGLNAAKVTTGTMSGDRIIGGVIYGSGTGANIKLDVANMIYLTANTGVNINGGGAQINCNSSIITMYGGGGINITGNAKVTGTFQATNSTNLVGTYIDGQLTVTDRTYSNITSSGTSSFQRIDINSSVYSGGYQGVSNTIYLQSITSSYWEMRITKGIVTNLVSH
jgi:hypothetical protein